MLKNVLGLHELRVADIMVPRADIVAVAHDAALAEVLGVFRTRAIRACPFMATRSTIRAAWCTSAISSIMSPRRLAESTAAKRATPAPPPCGASAFVPSI